MLKKLIPAYILSFVIAYTVFVHEPIILYANNKADLWFDFMSMTKPIILLFLISFIDLLLVFTIIKALSKKDKVYNILLVIAFIVYFASYIQGNYMLKNLPGLDGTKIDWSGFMVQNIITLIMWLVLIVTYIFTIKKFKFEKVIKTSSKIVLAVFIMLLASSLSTMLTTRKMFMKKYPVFVTAENYGVFSNDKNFVIYVIDAADSRYFQKEL